MSTTTSESMVQAVITQPEDIVAVILDAFDDDQLRQLVLELASRLRPEEPQTGPAAILAQATRQAAEHFGVVPELLLAKGRQKAVADARSVAQTAARRCGLTLPRIGAHFNQDHSTIVHAIRKVSAAPDLDALANQIAQNVAGAITAAAAA